MTHYDEYNQPDLPEEAEISSFHERFQDPACLQLFTDLQQLYRIDEDDQRSVEHAWERLQHTMGQEMQHSRLHVKDMPLSGNHRYRTHTRIYRTGLSTLVATLLALLLISSTITVFTLAQQHTHTGNQTKSLVPTPTMAIPTPHQLQPTLGNHLGAITLGMTSAEVDTMLGSADTFYKDGENKTMNMFYSSKDVQVMLKLNNSTPDVVQITAWGSFTGTTDEGCHLGMSVSEFTHLYRYSSIKRHQIEDVIKPIPLFVKQAQAVFSITDKRGTTLWAIFDPQMHLAQIVLQGQDVQQ